MAPVTPVAIGVIAAHQFGIAGAQLVPIGIHRQAKNAQCPAFIRGHAGPGMGCGRIKIGFRAGLYLAGTRLRPAGYGLQWIGKISPARGGIYPGTNPISGAKSAVFALPAGNWMLRGHNLVRPQPGKIIIPGIESANMIEAEPAIIARPVKARRAGAQVAIGGRAKFAIPRTAGPIAGSARTTHAAMKSVVKSVLRHRQNIALKWEPDFRLTGGALSAYRILQIFRILQDAVGQWRRID